MKIYLPWLGEFGTELLRWVPRIKADKDPKIVCYEQGKGCLYPDGEKYVLPRISESDRKCAGSLNQKEIWGSIKDIYGEQDYQYPSTTGIGNSLEFFRPQTKEYNFDCDIAIFPRWRHNSKRLNWEQWPDLVSRLLAEGLKVFACGAKDSSFHLDCPSAWDYDNELEASIWAITHSKIRIGLMTALSVLSLSCEKRPWIIVNQRGMKCNIGREAPNYIFLWQSDHKEVGWRVLPHLNEPKKIVQEIICNQDLS